MLFFRRCARLIATVVALTTVGLSVGADEAPGDFVIKRGDALDWQTSPSFPGIEFAILEGHPDEEGLYVIRARFSPGRFSKPHYHSTDRLVTVISGTWYAGTDASFDKDKTIPLGPGDFMKHPAGAVHYDGARDEVAIVEIRGMGPVVTTPVEIDTGTDGS